MSSLDEVTELLGFLADRRDDVRDSSGNISSCFRSLTGLELRWVRGLMANFAASHFGSAARPGIDGNQGWCGVAGPC
jgi:hypothetical protein